MDKWKLITKKASRLYKNKIKSQFQNLPKKDVELFPLSSFNLKSANFFITYRTCVIESNELDSFDRERFIIPNTPGVVNLGTLKISKQAFFTRMLFRECNPGMITSDKFFQRWLRIRDVYFIDAMLFIREGDKVFCLFREDGPLYLALQNVEYYSLLRQLK